MWDPDAVEALDGHVDTRSLQCFFAVARAGSFSRAAAELHLSQQAISVRIKRLEQALRVPLFHRTTRRVVLTDAGTSLLGPVQRLLEQLDEVLSLASALADGETGSVRMGYSPAAGFGFMPRFVSWLAEQHPGIRITTVPLWSDRLDQELATGRVDAAVVFRPAEPAGRDEVVLWDGTFDVLVARDHPLASFEEITLGDLRGLALALPRRSASPGIVDAVCAACRAAGLEPELIPLRKSDTVTPAPVYEGRAFTIWPTLMPPEYVPSGLARLPIAPPRPRLLVSLRYDGRRTNVALARCLESLSA